MNISNRRLTADEIHALAIAPFPVFNIIKSTFFGGGSRVDSARRNDVLYDTIKVQGYVSDTEKSTKIKRY